MNFYERIGPSTQELIEKFLQDVEESRKRQKKKWENLNIKY